MLLRTADVNFFSVVNRLANERHILQTEERDIAPQEFLRPSKRILCLPVKGALAEDRAEQAVVGQQVFDLAEDTCPCVRW